MTFRQATRAAANKERTSYRKMDTCFTYSLEAHWTCTDEVKTSEAKHIACADESNRFENLLDARWSSNGAGMTGARLP